MSQYQPPYSITNTMLSYISSISERLGKISVTQDFTSKPHLQKNSRIQSIHSSLKIDLILGEISSQVNDDYLTEYVKKLLNVMDYDVPYTANAIMEKLGLKSKESFRRNYLNPAMDLNLIEMTLPNKPTSRNQRYIKK